MNAIYNSAAIQARIDELLGEAQALEALASSEDREATTEESARFDEIMATLGDATHRTGLYANLDRATRYEGLLNHSKAPRNTVPKPFQASDKQTVPAKPRAHGSLKAFRGENSAETAYASGQWLRAVLSKGRDEKAVQAAAAHGFILAAATEGTDSAGGYLVPDPLAATIIDVVERYAVLRPLCRTVTMTSDTRKEPKRTGGLTVDYPGEATAITASDKTWGQVSLTAVKRAILSKISSELSDDALINVADDWTMEVGRAFGLQEDNEIINGDGSSTYGGETGLVNAIHANATTSLSGSSQTAFANTDLVDLQTLVGTLPEKYHPMASWLMRRSTWHTNILPLITASGIATTPDLQRAAAPQLLGYPVYFSDYMPADGAGKVICFLGSFRDGILIGDRRMMSLAFSTDFAFDEDVVTGRATRRYDINVHSTGSASTDRAIVALKTDAS